MFIGRERELATLEKLYSSDAFEMPVVYGRRRVGKTKLLTEFISGKRAIYFQARRTNAQANLEMISRAILAEYGTELSLPSFESFDAAFNAVLEISHQQRLVLVIDEYPYLAQSFPEISSMLQERIDHEFKEGSKLMLVLCGSSLSFMEEQVLGYQSPLYGRRTAQLRIEPLDFFETRSFWPAMPQEDAAVLYGVTNGVPAYVEMVNGQASALENIKELLLRPEGYLYEEPSNLLLQECRSPEQYDAIIQAIACGRSRLNEIASMAKAPESNTRAFLRKLESIGIVKREHPFGNDSSKKTIYALSDSMFSFWYRFVPRNMGLIENGMPDLALERIEPKIPEFMGPIFEKICMQWIVREARRGAIEVAPAQMGRWWGTDPRTKTQEEIDIVVDDGDSRMLLAECKWRNEPTGADVAKKLVDRSVLVGHGSKTLMVFSKAGFTQGCKEYADSQGIRLVDFAQMLAAK